MDKEFEEAANKMIAIQDDDWVSKYAMDIAREIYNEAQALKPSPWISVEKGLPGKPCLAFYRNNCGSTRVVRARYIKRFSEESNYDDYHEITDEYHEEYGAYYLKEGWYEEVDNWPDFTDIYIGEGVVTHYMYIPELPHEVD